MIKKISKTVYTSDSHRDSETGQLVNHVDQVFEGHIVPLLVFQVKLLGGVKYDVGLVFLFRGLVFLLDFFLGDHMVSYKL